MIEAKDKIIEDLKEQMSKMFTADQIIQKQREIEDLTGRVDKI
jgi:hypothetical protein